jgi:Fe-S cluster assembly iron-binding protein IscA
MVTVTPQAAGKLMEQLQAAETEPGTSFRLVNSPSEAGSRLQLVLDQEKKGDQVVESKGVKVLLLDPEVTELLDGQTISFEETSQGGGFKIAKPGPTS